METVIFQTGEDPWQVFCLPAGPDGHAFQARVDLRFLPGPGRWCLSVSDAMIGQVYVNSVPVICSYGEINDLLFPFRFLFQGAGIGSFFCLKAVDAPDTPDPARHNLGSFRLVWADRIDSPTG